MVESSDPNRIFSKRKAISTLLPYAIFLEQRGQQGMMNAFLRVARVSNSRIPHFGKFLWHRVVLYISRLFEKRSPTSLNRVITLISPYVPWERTLNNPVAAARWAAAALAIPYTEEVGQSVVDALLQIAYIDFLRPHIPLEIWRWLKKRPSLPLVCPGLQVGGYVRTLTHVRSLGDIDILKSYFLLVWTDQFRQLDMNISEMRRSIREDFGRAGLERHREDLIARLDHVLGQLNQRDETTWVREVKAQYTRLRDELLEVHVQ